MEADAPVVLRIYPDFTEVRRELTTDGAYRLTFSEEQMSQIVPDSIGVDSDDLQMEAITRKSTNLEGKTVYVRLENTKSPRKAILVRGDDWLVKDEESGRYYNVIQSQLEFEQPPARSVFDVDFKFSKPTSTTLSYLLRTISWTPKYQIKVSEKDDEATIKCIAVLKNQSPKRYCVQKAELYGGQLSLAVPYAPRTAMFAAMAAAPSDYINSAPVSDYSSSEVAGIFQYELYNAFVLDSDSTVSIEFLRPKIVLSQASQLEVTNPGDLTQSMNRLYALISDQFLPSGNVSIRHGDRLVGSHYLVDLPAGERREFVVGRDASSVVDRKEKVLRKTELVTELEVELKISNNHSKCWDFRYREKAFGAELITYQIRGDEVRHEKNGIVVTCQIEPGKSFLTEYTITKRIKDPTQKGF